MLFLCRALLLPAREILSHLKNWPVMMEVGRFSDLLPNLEKNIPIYIYVIIQSLQFHWHVLEPVHVISTRA